MKHTSTICNMIDKPKHPKYDFIHVMSMKMPIFNRWPRYVLLVPTIQNKDIRDEDRDGLYRFLLNNSTVNH
jgi:hypothetical protein